MVLREKARKIIFCGEVHFEIVGYKHICRIGGKKNLRKMPKKPLYSVKVTVWCGYWEYSSIWHNDEYLSNILEGMDSIK